MFSNLRNRIIVIAILAVAAGLSLWQNKRRTTTPTQEGRLVNLGLDLQGGMHLALELDQSERPSADPAKEIDLALTVLRKRMDQFGVLEPLIQKVGDQRIVVELPGLKDPERAKGIVQRSAFLEFKITDETQALDKALPAMDRALRELGITAVSVGGSDKPSAVQELLGGDSAQKAAGDSTAPITGGALSTLIEGAGVAGQATPGEFAVKLGAWRRVDSLLHLPEVRRLWPRGIDLKWSADTIVAGLERYRLLYALDDRAIITGTSLVNAVAQVDPLTNGAEVNFELDRPGGRRFGQETARHVGDYMAIILDGMVQGRPPVIQSRIDRQGRIQLSGRSLQEAQDLALTLRAGSLPTPLKIVEDRQVGPSLGQDSIRGGIIAGLVGVGLVILIMVGYYAGGGVVAVVALVLYSLLAFGTLALFEATLTLPGFAGFILSIGIAVDANVLIFERIREELALGKTLRLAIDEGYKHARPAIVDSNLTTVLTALFLFQFGTGPVQGFAVTLIVGIFASLFTAVFVTKTFYLWWLKRNPEATEISVGKVRLFRDANYDFIAVRRYAYGVTGAILAVGLVALAIRGINYSVEFTGGTLVQVKAPAATDQQLRAGLGANGLGNAEIQPFGAPGEFVIRVRVGETAADAENTQAARVAVNDALTKTLGAQGFEILRTEAVGAKVGGELQRQAFLAIFLSFFAVLAYLAYRFEWRFGLAAVIATAHDVLMTIAFLAVMRIEVSLVVVAAFLTMVGYSLNDTIIIFDRVRENLHKFRRDDFISILNRSINQTLPRSILTHGTTLATLLALAFFGGEVIRPFSLVMFFGVFTGTFSSIFIAAPVLLLIERRWPGTDARGVRAAGRSAAPAVTAPRRPQPVA
jgi:protein-export membrane protein SecD/preprotein translocase SecF subunit